MKKLCLFVALITLIGATLFSQDTTEEKSTATEVVDKIFDKTTEAIQGIAKALQVPAEKVFTILVKQQVVNSITWGIIDLLFLILLFISARYIWRWGAKYCNGTEGLSVFGAFILLGVPVIIILCTIKIVVMGFVNPEYGAIKEILSVFSS